MSPQMAIILINLIQYRFIGLRNTIPPHLIILSMLQFFATTGSFQRTFSNDFQHPIGQSTASHYLNVFLEAILQLGPRFITFPTSHHERQRISAGFQRTIRIPNVIRLVDGFIVCMKRPSENEEAFFNYKHGPRMNVQIIADHQYIIRSIRIVPGSNNDQFNWNYSEARDSGYANSSILLTPILDAPQGTLASIYTEELVHTRCKVEQTIRILSGVWKVISRSRNLYYSVDKVAMIIKVAAILHNFLRIHRVHNEISNNHIHGDNNNNNLNKNFGLDDGQNKINRILDLYYTYYLIIKNNASDKAVRVTDWISE